MTKEECKIVSAYTGVLMCDMDEFHGYINALLERPVFTHELAQSAIQDEIKEKVRPAFLRLCAEAR